MPVLLSRVSCSESEPVMLVGWPGIRPDYLVRGGRAFCRASAIQLQRLAAGILLQSLRPERRPGCLLTKQDLSKFLGKLCCNGLWKVPPAAALGSVRAVLFFLGSC